jgi:hypothetical protein
MDNINIDEIVDNLRDRVQQEIELILKDQIKLLGINFKDAVIKRVLYPDDPNVLAVYKLNDIVILIVRISDNKMGIEFNIPKLNPIA